MVKALKDGTALKINGVISLDGNSDKTKAVPLPVRSYTIKTAGEENFDEVPLTPNIHSLELSSMLITSAIPGRGGFSVAYIGHGIPGQIKGRALLVLGISNAVDVITFELKSTCSEISFWCYSVLFSGGYYSTFDNNGKLLQRLNLPVTGKTGTEKYSPLPPTLKG